MMRKTDWGKGVEVQRTNVVLPRALWQEARVQAMKESRNFQELVAEAVRDYLRKVTKKGGRNA